MAIDEALLRRQLEGLKALNEWELQEKVRTRGSFSMEQKWQSFKALMRFALSVAPHSPIEQSRLHQYHLRELADLQACMVRLKRWQDERSHS